MTWTRLGASIVTSDKYKVQIGTQGKMWPFPEPLWKLLLLKRLLRQVNNTEEMLSHDCWLGNRILGRPDVHSEYICTISKIQFTQRTTFVTIKDVQKKCFPPGGNLKVFPGQSQHRHKHIGSLRTGLREWCSPCVCKELCRVEGPNHWLLCSHTSPIFSADELLLCWSQETSLVYFLVGPGFHYQWLPNAFNTKKENSGV